jgi:hypothetical protein
MVFISFGWIVVTLVYFAMIFFAARALGAWALSYW